MKYEKKGMKPLEFLHVEGVGEVRSGVILQHPTFGIGEVETIGECVNTEEHCIRINFEKHGYKAIVPKYGKLQLAKKRNESSILRLLMGIFKNTNLH